MWRSCRRPLVFSPSAGDRKTRPEAPVHPCSSGTVAGGGHVPGAACQRTGLLPVSPAAGKEGAGSAAPRADLAMSAGRYRERRQLWCKTDYCLAADPPGVYWRLPAHLPHLSGAPSDHPSQAPSPWSHQSRPSGGKVAKPHQTGLYCGQT